MQDTIFAFATPPGQSALAVVRISGPDCARLASEIIHRPLEPRKAELVWVRDPKCGDIIDQAIALWFPAPASFSGEDCLELHVHGGRAVRHSLAAALGGLPNVRPAEAGEFVRRAFVNGKLDLAELEGLADLLSAQTEAQRRQAWVQAAGGLHRQCGQWRQMLLEPIALLEATIDFADEDDTPASVIDSVSNCLVRLQQSLEEHASHQVANEIVHEGMRVAIVGAPNAGKSSLLNALANRDVAIVSDQPGTTRDILEVSLDIGGYLIRLQDTAGIRATGDKVEALGIARTRKAAEEAHVVLYLQEAERTIDLEVPSEKLLVVNTKSDIRSGERLPGLWVSSHTGAGIADLLNSLERFVTEFSAQATDHVIVNQRQVSCVKASLVHIAKARNLLDGGLPELICEELRLASSALGLLTGKIGTESVLGEIFSRFCIGK